MRTHALVLAVFAIFVTCSKAFSDPIPVVSADGILMGARNLHLLRGDGFDFGTWDVDFRDGTCAQFYSECVHPNPAFGLVSILNPGVQQRWESATIALHQFILIDGPAGMFNSFPNLTNGCQGAAVTRCAIFSPEFLFNGSFVEGPATLNLAGAGECTPYCHDESFSFPVTANLADDPTKVWAVWTRSPVPEPTTDISLGLAVIAIVLGKVRLESHRSKAIENTIS